MKHCDDQPFKLLITLKTDLLNECFKVFFLQNSKVCKITTPKECVVTDTMTEFERIQQKYGL